MEPNEEDRRLDPELRERFSKAVEVAAARAAQQVAQIHRRRLVTQTAIATAVVCAALGVLGFLALRSSDRAFSHANAVYDCDLITQVSSTLGHFVQSDADLRNRENNAALSGEIGAGFRKIIPARALAAAIKQQHDDVARLVAAWDRDAQTLRGVAGTNCQTHVGG